MSTATVPRRPAIVTVALVLVYAGALGGTAIGVLVLLSRYRVPTSEVLAVSLLGAGVILFGLLSLAVASGVARGSRLARGLVTTYLAIELALHVWTVVGTDWDAIVLALILADAFVIAALWLPPGSRHFRR